MSEPRMMRRQSAPARVGADAPPATGTDTVTVGCKIPNGIHMILYDIIREELKDLGGNVVPSFRTFPRAGAPTFILNGCAVDIDKMRAGQLPKHTIVQGKLSGTGAGLTSGIPRGFWDEWSETVGKDLVARGQVFAEPNDQRAAAKAREMANIRTGLEPIDPADPGPRAGLASGSIRQDANPNSPTE